MLENLNRVASLKDVPEQKKSRYLVKDSEENIVGVYFTKIEAAKNCPKDGQIVCVNKKGNIIGGLSFGE
ncbi:hypothetical protein KKG80_01845, partial [Patescibacteria group bacterium]|nr:hypothetical protein [Patescibacteria group bacterium]